jgi:hypothetical protein
MPAAMTRLPDFDTLLRIARDDAGALERLRHSLVEETIAAAPAGSRQRLRALQWRIDAERRRAGTPLAACVRISSMLHDSLQQLATAFADPASLAKAGRGADVVSLARPRRH